MREELKKQIEQEAKDRFPAAHLLDHPSIRGQSGYIVGAMKYAEEVERLQNELTELKDWNKTWKESLDQAVKTTIDQKFEIDRLSLEVKRRTPIENDNRNFAM